MRICCKFAYLVIALASSVGFAASESFGESLPLPPGESYAIVVDADSTAAGPGRKSREHSFSAWQEKGTPLRVRATPSQKGRVIAEFAGGKTVLVYGSPIRREGMLWADVDCLGVRGWVPQSRLKLSNDAGYGGLLWDMRVFSPSGKIVVQFENHSAGSIRVVRDGVRRKKYGLDLENEGGLYVGSAVLFAKDENLFALEHGGASAGGEVFVFERDSKGHFVNRNLMLADRSWRLIVEAGWVPADARLSHFYMQPEKTVDTGFEMTAGGNYASGGQTNFGPFRVVWNAKANKVSLAK